MRTRVQEAGLLTREPAEHDRRAMRVWLTEKGLAMREGLEDVWATLERVSVDGLDADTVERSIVEHGARPPADERSCP